MRRGKGGGGGETKILINPEAYFEPSQGTFKHLNEKNE